MIWPIIIMAVGLVLTLAGVIIAFVSKPPVLDEVDAEKLWKWFNDRPQTPEAARAAAEKAARSEKLKFRFSFVGVGLLVAGTALQLAGAIGQLVLLARWK
jgi:hypothetical protein